jgi:hypothetical protein
MAHRLQMKLGVVPEADRLPDSPDTILHYEPTIGSQARSKGHLYLLVTCRIPGYRAREATRLVAESIRTEYYYDESAGIRVCLIKAIQAANKRLAHARERGSLGQDPGPIGVGVAVVRDNELYVGTVGPAEAYLSRGARLSTLPDPHRDRGLPSADLEPDVWRGEMNVGDQLVLISPNLLAPLGPEELKDALVTLHPQSAMDLLHQRFVAAGGSGSDGAIEIEAGEVAVSRAGRAPVPVRPAEPLAGAPDRSPIPLADSVAGGMAAAQDGARRARLAAGGVLGRILIRVQDALPNRSPASRRVTPMSARREMQRRAAVAILSLVVVVGGLGAAVFFLGGHLPAGQVISSIEAGQQALAAARADLLRITAPGVDLVTSDAPKATNLLKDAIAQLATASRAGIPDSTIAPLRLQAVAGLDRIYKMTDVLDTKLYAFPSAAKADLRAVVQGPDGAAYVLDAASGAVYRIDLAHGKAVAIYRKGTHAAGAIQAQPKLLAVGGKDLLIVDAKNVIWKWRAANSTGKGTTTRIQVNGSAEWGSDIIAIGTFIRNADQNLYNLYVVDPSAKSILAYSPQLDGGGYPSAPSNRLATARDVSDVTAMYIDGDIWLAEGGNILRLVGGKSEGWTAAAPGDDVIRPVPTYRLVTSGTAKREGNLYGFDPANSRVIAISKSTGAFMGQYRLTGSAQGWSDLRGWYVEPGVAEVPDALVWINATGVHRSILEQATSAPASPGPSGGASPRPSAGASLAPAP